MKTVKTKKSALTIYRIQKTIDGKLVKKFEDAIAKLDELTMFKLRGDYDFDARLFVAESSKKEPSWLNFLKPAFGELSEIKESVTNSAVLIAKVKYGEDCFFAITFGFGRYLLKPNCIEPNYGMRVALNAFYPTESVVKDPTFNRIRSVDAKTIAANTLRTRKQMDRRTTFEEFGLDIQHDLLSAITGRPLNTTKWGTRISGANALYLHAGVDVNQLGKLLRQIEETYHKNDYREQFAWIDNVKVVTEQKIIAKLEKKLLSDLKKSDIKNLQLAPPEIIDWDTMNHFCFSLEENKKCVDLELKNYIRTLKRKKELNRLKIQHLREEHYVLATDADGSEYRWLLFRCIGGEIKITGETYILSEGEFYKVSTDYLSDLNNYINRIPECNKTLPDTKINTSEGTYNEQAANSCTKYLLLDKRLVRISTKTSPIEICDILTHDGCFIHIKRKLASSSLSHLFGQGYVSGELFYVNPEYQKAVFAQIKDAEKEQNKKIVTRSSKESLFSSIAKAISPSNYEIVYAIIAKWKKRTLVDALPFFSKVNLRRHTRDLRHMGYKVSIKRIQVD